MLRSFGMLNFDYEAFLAIQLFPHNLITLDDGRWTDYEAGEAFAGV